MLRNLGVPRANAQRLVDPERDVQLGTIEEAAAKLQVSVSELLSAGPQDLGGPELSARARVIAEQLDELRAQPLRHAAAYAELRDTLDRLTRPEPPEAGVGPPATPEPPGRLGPQAKPIRPPGSDRGKPGA